MRRRILAVLVVLGLLLVLGVAGCNSADGTGAEVVSDESEDASVDEAEPASEEADAIGTRQNPLPVGTTAKVGSWEVAVTEVNTNANDVVAQANTFNEPPVEGSQYVLVTVNAKYVGDESGTFWVDMSYKFYGSGGNTFDSGGESMAVAPNPISDAGETFPDASISGNIVFEVPADQLEGGAIIMEESLSFDDTRTFFAIQ